MPDYRFYIVGADTFAGGSQGFTQCRCAIYIHNPFFHD